MVDGQSVTFLSLITAGDEEADDDIREAGAVQAVRSLFGHRKEIPIGTIQAELTRVQGELDGVLERFDTQEHHGFTLSEVEVSLGISAGGSIGVVTAGMTASLTLHFTKGPPAQPGAQRS
jgi:hypothetical protein